MIITRTPFRMSFFGGGTDYPTYVAQHGGAVLSTTFDKYSYVTCRWLPPFFDHKYHVTYSKIESAREIDEIRHPAIKEILLSYENGYEQGVEIHCDADLPARSGLGSSSAFVVGLLQAMEGLRGRHVSNEWLAKKAIHLEQNILKENVGSQDQVATSFGGLNVINFHKNGSFSVDPLPLSESRKKLLNSHLLLFFTGFSRFSSTVAKAQLEKMEENKAQLATMRAMVDQATEILVSDRDIRAFGELLHNTWILKRGLAQEVSTTEVDAIYEVARQHGAIGGKLLGAGGGGFIIFFVEPARQHDVVRALSGLIRVPFKFEDEGSRIIYYRT
ncbi:kinase [Desulfovibrio sp. ZJ200]|uniref:GHMP family kinase ATP-binding protein n=1 Tax=Desulfovibrio sp. ZJ200 TaxID=2709792 RepID=UPI0013EC6B37|nr:kinase [Desulfovibrio sp. ZJ200]